MSNSLIEAPIYILGKNYQIKCTPADLNGLQKAALFLEEKMREVNDNKNVLNLDRVAIVAALNIIHELFSLEAKKQLELQNLYQRLETLQNKVETTLTSIKPIQLELASVGSAISSTSPLTDVE